MLSISDWIAFLTSEKNSNISNIISFAALFIAAFAIIKTVTTNSVVGAVVLTLIAVALAFIYLRTIGRYGHRAREAGKLLDDIMSGKESDPSKIEERWGEPSEKGKKKNK